MLLPPKRSVWVVGGACILSLLYTGVAAVVTGLYLLMTTGQRGRGTDPAKVGEGADVMVTVDAMKSTNKELRKQYGKINIDKSKDGFVAEHFQ